MFFTKKLLTNFEEVIATNQFFIFHFLKFLPICEIQSERSAVSLNAADKRVKPSFPLVYLSTDPSSSQSGIGMVMIISLFEAKFTRAGQIC